MSATATADAPRPSQLRILVDDFPASFHFYRSVLGLTPQDEEQAAGPYACFTFDDEGTDVALFDRAAMTFAIGTMAADGTLPPRSAEHLVLAFRVGDADAAYTEAVADGAPSVSEPADQPHWGMRVAHVRAPEGTVIEFCSWDD